MGEKKKWLFVTLCLTVFAPISNAANWEKRRDEALTQYKAKRYPEAIKLAEKAVVSAKAEYGQESREYAQSLNDLAALYRVQSKMFRNQAQAIRQKLGITGNMLGISTEVFFDEVEDARSAVPGAAQADPQGEDVSTVAPLPHR